MMSRMTSWCWVIKKTILKKPRILTSRARKTGHLPLRRQNVILTTISATRWTSFWTPWRQQSEKLFKFRQSSGNSKDSSGSSTKINKSAAGRRPPKIWKIGRWKGSIARPKFWKNTWSDSKRQRWSEPKSFKIGKNKWKKFIIGRRKIRAGLIK